ncbi:sensor histidine kinase [Serratia fonticola]|uniref:sensor histidine kinase n=1 Tax=Serratia fonticola TaxID=47917 RepID=UPI002DBB6EB8|nr:HAMP domain-containing sensor histidine kinase [Serratia fonticola]MEB7884967.1 HAMP domain-containing histidine kinase [Serratia fonticola]
MCKWFSSRTVFSMLFLNTVVSTCALVAVLVFSLQRVADEHPRRYLAKTLFSNLVMNKTPAQLANMTVDGIPLEVIPQSKMHAPEYQSYQPLLEMTLSDPDGIAMTANDDQYMAAAYSNGNFVVLPLFGRSLSSQALGLLGWVAAAIILILLVNFYSIHLLTRPFIELRRGVRRADKGDLKYRIPLERTYGEYHTLADSFNKMLHRINHIHEARRHMLLAIPHEVRTPLARLKVRKDLITDEPLRLAILGDIVNVERILDAILYTEKTQAGEGEIRLRKIDLASFFNEIVAEQQNGKSPIEIAINTTATSFYSHPTMMVVLMRNLIGNAVFYGKSKPVTVTVDDKNGGLHIKVTDRGIGIAEDQLPFLTEPFWRADQSRQRESGGYGLGLYICKTIVDGLHGKLVIESTEGQGTSVLITFPNAFESTHSKEDEDAN